MNREEAQQSGASASASAGDSNPAATAGDCVHRCDEQGSGWNLLNAAIFFGLVSNCLLLCAASALNLPWLPPLQRLADATGVRIALVLVGAMLAMATVLSVLAYVALRWLVPNHGTKSGTTATGRS